MIFSREEILDQTKEWKQNGDVIVFTNGVFDILHAGHVDYLEKASARGHRLVVGVNSDASVRRLDKGPERPIHNQDARAKVLDALRCMDAVVIFDEDTPLELISKILPNVLVKGGDYDAAETNPSSKKYIVGSKEVNENGGEVVVIPLLEGFSTTAIVEKLRKG